MASIETPQPLRSIIRRLSPASPVTDRFSAEWRRRAGDGQQEREKVWYRTQHEHWLGAAVTAALSNPRTMMAMSAAIRRVIPWQTIESAILAE